MTLVNLNWQQLSVWATNRCTTIFFRETTIIGTLYTQELLVYTPITMWEPHSRCAHMKNRDAQSIFFRETTIIGTLYSQELHVYTPITTWEPHSRRVYTKNRDVQIACLRHRVSHYRVIRDVRLSASPINIHGRCAMSEHATYDFRLGPYATNLRCALTVRVSYF
jgi:hypothetical protein